VITEKIKTKIKTGIFISVCILLLKGIQTTVVKGQKSRVEGYTIGAS